MSCDHDHYDRARDELAVPDPYATEWETISHHGLIKPEDVPARPLPAGTPLNASIAQDVERAHPAGAQPASSPNGAGWARGNP